MAVVGEVRSRQSERERVIAYVWKRTQVAFEAGADEEAHNLHRLMERLEGMTDVEYEEAYSYCQDSDL